jgi:hypothetical protein
MFKVRLNPTVRQLLLWNTDEALDDALHRGQAHDLADARRILPQLIEGLTDIAAAARQRTVTKLGQRDFVQLLRYQLIEAQKTVGRELGDLLRIQ